MLDALRRMTQGIVAKVLLGILALSFAIWGVAGSTVSGGSRAVITVGDTEVGMPAYRLAYLNAVNRLESQVGERLGREQIAALGVDAAVQQRAVADAMLEDAARELGLGVSDERLAASIGSDPVFSSGGNFSRARVQEILRSIGMSENDFIATQRGSAVRNQLVGAVAAGADLPQAFYEAYGQYLGEKRVFRIALLTPDVIASPAAPSDAELASWFAERKAQYRAPEYRKVALLRLLPQDIARPAEVSAEAVAEAYERNKNRYTTPEKRRVDQLAFPDRAAADAAAARLGSGTSFDAIATELGRNPADLSLGEVRREDIPDQAVAEAAFSLGQGATSGVVEGVFGPVILRVTEVVPGQVQPLAAVESQLRDDLAREEAAKTLFETHDRIEDERAAGDPLQEVARKLGLDLRVIEAVDRQGLGPDGQAIEDLPDADRVLGGIFDTAQGVEADPVALRPEGFVWYEVLDVQSDRDRELTEVRDRALADMNAQRLADGLKELAGRIVDRTNKGESFEAVVTELAPSVSVQVSPEVTRTGEVPGLPREAVEAGFAVAEGKAYAAAGVAAPAQAAIEVNRVVAGSEPMEAALRRDVGAAVGEDLLQNMVEQLRGGREVRLNQAALDQAIAR